MGWHVYSLLGDRDPLVSQQVLSLSNDKGSHCDSNADCKGGYICRVDNKSGSKGSLFGGLTGAVLMSAAYYLMQSPETKELGDALAFGASLLFALVFGIRFAATGKVMPAGFLLAVSMSLTALTFSAYLQDKSLM
ncbi:hypothetical protein CTI12_AA029990 [Artemisia annua]|uniref:TMEM14 family n=1 Tax=Artemisia annua TaxID=35608 RepID=A0A2U1QH43_ARTAN|nr:hypothetical protein CTI12_AA029990 [Artemisia annua]